MNDAKMFRISIPQLIACQRLRSIVVFHIFRIRVNDHECYLSISSIEDCCWLYLVYSLL